MATLLAIAIAALAGLVTAVPPTPTCSSGTCTLTSDVYECFGLNLVSASCTGLGATFTLLDLHNNAITSLSAGQFATYTQMRKLLLYSNAITIVDVDAFLGLSNLNGL